MRLVPAVLAVALVAGCSSGSPSPSASGSVATPSGSGPASPSSPSASGSRAPSTAPVTPTATTLAGPPRLAPVGTFASPVYVTAPAGDARLFVVEQAGRVKVLRAGRAAATFLDIVPLVGSGGERGLLSMAFAPDYATSGLFYVDYTDTNGDSRIAEYHVSANADRADPASRRELLKVGQPYPNHNGGLLLFDPSGRLLIGFGDGGSAGDPGNRSQNLGELLGKILRIDPRPSGGRPYGIPADNPFVKRSGARPEIWAYGVRNPWRFSFDPANGDLYLADVGQNRTEEVDVVPPARQSGANYGWSVYEGNDRFKGGSLTPGGPVVTPVHTYGHDGGRCSVTGGVVYRGSVAALRGRYLFADYCAGTVWSFAAGTAARPAVSALPFGGGQPVSFGVDGHGEAYVVSAGGDVWRITAG